MNAVIDKWMADGVLRPFKPIREPTQEDMRKPFYCRYHRFVGHGTRDCRAVRRTFHEKISNGTLNLTREQGVQRNPLPQHPRGKATAAVLFHDGADDNEAASGTSLPPVAISALQRSPAFRTLFNQLGLKEKSRRTATKALVSIAAALEHTASQLKLTPVEPSQRLLMPLPSPMRTWRYNTLIIVNNDVHVRRALVDTGASLNLIPASTLRATGIPLSRIAGAPIEVFSFTGIHECTLGSIQLVLKVGPVVALTRFHVIDSTVSYHALLRRPWLHKHKLVPSTYHQCVKRRFNGKPLRIPANPTPFDLSEAHYFEATFYDE
ncbi:uncharacterized protein LOC142616329 [Castanea sativa]|uniref:uncharacterized protein LOC142616329 n=1 Tax=Castanea sativa TaxID=21020 RepID=UPI003F64EEBB